MRHHIDLVADDIRAMSQPVARYEVLSVSPDNEPVEWERTDDLMIARMTFRSILLRRNRSGLASHDMHHLTLRDNALGKGLYYRP